MLGVIMEDGTVLSAEDGKRYILEFRGADKVLIDATAIGGSGAFQAKPWKQYIYQIVEFEVSPTGHGYNYKIITKL